MRHKDTIGLFDYWNEIRQGREAPMRSEISPAALGRLLPSVMLLEKRDDGEIIFRLAGTRICSLRCREMRGLRFTSLFEDKDHPTLAKVLRSVDQGKALAILDTTVCRGESELIPVEIALFPLADDTTRILGIASLKSHPYWFGAEPARLALRGIRYMDPQADLLFLQNRPSVPVGTARVDAASGRRGGLRLVNGGNDVGPKRALRIFTVHEGGKK